MIRIERAIRQLARLRDFYLLRLELCGSERQELSGYLRVEVALSPRCHKELMALMERWKRRGDL